MARIIRRKRAVVADPNKLQKVAAAEAACREIVNALAENAEFYEAVAEVDPYNHMFTAETKESGWRKVALNMGHKLVWKGGVRASSKGDILFSFEPDMNSALEARGVLRIEVPHGELLLAFGQAFIDGFVEIMGATPEELLAQAMHSIDHADEKAAEKVEEEPEPGMDVTSMPGFGAWA